MKKISNNTVSNNVFNVRMHDVDPYNIVHHSVYLIWLEECWNTHIKELPKSDIYNIDLNDYQVIDLKCKYINSVTLNDVVNVYTTIVNTSRNKNCVIISFKQWINNGKKNKKILVCFSKVSFRIKHV